MGWGKDSPDDGTEDDLDEDDEISTLRDSAEGGVNSTVDEVSHKALKDKEANEKCSAWCNFEILFYYINSAVILSLIIFLAFEMRDESKKQIF